MRHTVSHRSCLIASQGSGSLYARCVTQERPRILTARRGAPCRPHFHQATHLTPSHSHLAQLTPYYFLRVSSGMHLAESLSNGRSVGIVGGRACTTTCCPTSVHRPMHAGSIPHCRLN
ncbi:hypothetical protein E2C01_075012 [Portunus trituberculatus]|uniref:Uncharacterized protein n=1 Tax=Portunus trituberculatus TaxID=210409 RepID=A0A5B7I9L2_PORTR|nr:hypothetical protein [Portunus trituberculatus]